MPTDDPMQALWARPRFGSGLGLHRMLDALDHLDPSRWRGADAIKITGSNGKGSTATMVAAILQALGLRVGLYTSPHLRRIHERIRVQGEPIDDAALRDSAAWFEALARDHARLHPGDDYGIFEALTAIALHALARAEVDVIVAEAGIGGRYDPTRVIPGRTCGLVSVDREHTALLGATEEAIALDKAELCPSGGELVVGTLEPELLRRLRAHAWLRMVTLDPVLRSAWIIEDASLAGTRARITVDPDLDPVPMTVAAPGAHQVHNAAVAIRLVMRWLRRNRPAIGADRVADAAREALASVQLPGRLEPIHHDPLVVIDIGHTPAAVHCAAEALIEQLGPTRVLLVAGISEDRDAEAVLAPLAPLAHRVIATRAAHRGAPVTVCAETLARLRPDLRVETAPSLVEAMPRAIETARADAMAVVVGGGLFVAMEAAAVVRGDDPAALRFL